MYPSIYLFYHFLWWFLSYLILSCFVYLNLHAGTHMFFAHASRISPCSLLPILSLHFIHLCLQNSPQPAAPSVLPGLILAASGYAAYFDLRLQLAQGWDHGKTSRKPLLFLVKAAFSCGFSLKPTPWTIFPFSQILSNRKPGLVVDAFMCKNPFAGKPFVVSHVMYTH